MNGILIIDKPEGPTSHDIVQAVRKRFAMRKVGHLGTLDPMATGVLPISLGKATRVAQFLPDSPKEYEGAIRFGFATTTYDREGTATTEERPLASTEAEIRDAMQTLKGRIEQVPPAFSAKKIGGVPAYKLARRNQEVVIAPSRVEIQCFEIVRLEGNVMMFRVVCSPGTYVRSLAHDLGARLGCGAHLTSLRRTQSGNFRIENAVKPDSASPADLIPVDRLLDFMPRVEVSAGDEVKVTHGNLIRADGDASFVRIFNKKGEFIAVASVENGWVRPRLVLISTTSEESHA